ncbi:MAG: C_GCAxxG_C_C family protein [Lachnospiraceae bacterium]|nr:C_GCAxxG_C_C family protein [Lachnospiraceae bacterium]
MTHAEKAKAYFEEGYNCAQAVTLAFAGEMGLDVEKAAQMASSFGGGLGRLREVCGCVSGMALAAGAICGYSDPKAREEKADHYALIQKLAGEFKERNGSIICRELLAGINNDTNPVPEERTESYYKKRPCADLVHMAAEILETEMKRRAGASEAFAEAPESELE